MRRTQLTINGTDYPFSSRDRYRAYQKNLSKSSRTVNGRLVTEEQAIVWVVEYKYDYFGDDLMRKCLEDLRSNGDLAVSFLPPGSDIMLDRKFRCVTWPAPTVAFYKGKPMWHNISFVLEAIDGEVG